MIYSNSGGELETKSFAETDDAYTVKGYAAIFNTVDQGNDIILPGAFAETLREQTPLLYFNHKANDLVIGSIIEAKEDAKGVAFTARLPKDDTFVRDRLGPQLKNRSLKGVSFGYNVLRAKRNSDGQRVISKLRCHEFSIVNDPMHRGAGITSFKTDDRAMIGIAEWKSFSAREREAHLLAVGISDTLAKRLSRLEREAQAKSRQREADHDDDSGPLAAILNSIKQGH
jgi:uncharacterized protein